MSLPEYDRHDALGLALDLTRQEGDHLAFGWGRHYCLGAALGRLQGEIAISTLVTRFPALSLAQPPEALSWESDVNMRTLAALPVNFAGLALDGCRADLLPRAAEIARLAVPEVVARRFISPEQALPVYLRDEVTHTPGRSSSN